MCKILMIVVAFCAHTLILLSLATTPLTAHLDVCLCVCVCSKSSLIIRFEFSYDRVVVLLVGQALMVVLWLLLIKLKNTAELKQEYMSV